MKKVFVLLMFILSICSSAFAECNLDMNRWKPLVTNNNYSLFFDTASIDVNDADTSFNVWECEYFSGNNTKCNFALCKERGLQSSEHYHYMLIEYNYKHRTIKSKSATLRDSNGKILLTHDYPLHLQKTHSIVPDTAVETIMLKIKDYIDNQTSSKSGVKEPLFPIVINNAKREDVLNHIRQVMKSGLAYDGTISEDNEKISLIFSSKESGNISELSLSFSANQQGKDVLLNGGAFTSTRFSDGKVKGPTRMLDWDKKLYKMALNIKALSTGRYSFGYGHKDHPEGQLITKVEPGSPFEKKGIKVGDILISVNGYQIKDHDYDDLFIKKILDFYSPEAKNFVIKHNGETKQYTIKPKFVSPEELQKNY